MTATTIRFQGWASASSSKHLPPAPNNAAAFSSTIGTTQYVQSRSQQPCQDVIKLSKREVALCKSEQCLSLETAPMCELGQPQHSL